LLNEVGDPVGEHPRLSAPRSGENQERPFGFQNGLLLNGVEIVK